MDILSRKTVFGVIVSNRGFFNAQLALDSRKEFLSILEQLGYGFVVSPVNGGSSGIVGTREEAKACAKLFREKGGEIDGIIVLLPNFGDEVAVIEALQGASLNVPVLVQASNDKIDKVDVKSRRDAFCGKISLCNNLYQYGIPFTDTTSHTTDISGEEFRGDIVRFASVCRVVRGLRGMRVGQIGTRPTAFQTVRFSEKILQKSGITTVPVDLSEILSAATAIPEDDGDLARKVADIKAYGKIPPSIKDGNILRQAQLSVAIDRWCEANDVDVSAVQCWNSLEENFGCAACLSMSMRGELKKPSACEADICGAISMYALTLASGNASALLDWNNNYGKESDLCVNTHCSNYPKSFMGTEVEISNLDLLGETFGADRCFGAIKGSVQPGEMTYFRISTDDTRGIVKAYLGEGEFIKKKFPMDGGIAVCRVPRLRSLLGTICANGFEHHVAMVRSHAAWVVNEAASKYLGWKVYYHEDPVGDAIVRL